MQKAIDHPRLVPLLILLVSLGILGSAYTSEVWGGIRPCILCWYQRYACGAAGAFALAGLAFGGELDMTLPIEQLREQLLATDFVPCDQVSWSLFGVSLAGYNLLVSLVLGSASLWAAKRISRGSPA
jgi:disulfide bond formation protein DsbB